MFRSFIRAACPVLRSREAVTIASMLDMLSRHNISTFKIQFHVRLDWVLFGYTVARKRVNKVSVKSLHNKVGAKSRPWFSPRLISNGPVIAPPIYTLPVTPSLNVCTIHQILRKEVPFCQSRPLESKNVVYGDSICVNVWFRRARSAVKKCRWTSLNRAQVVMQ